MIDRQPRQTLELADDVAVGLCNVTKRFVHYEGTPRTLRNLFIRSAKRRATTQSYFSVRDISIRVARGESVGIIGDNGAGKSTLLRLIAGIYWPSEGSVMTRGRLAPLIELGVGFHPELTGRENVFLYGSILGIPSDVLEAHYDDIVRMSGIAEFMDSPVKHHSSGMRARLGFAVATAIRPDILLLDEVFAVGDVGFREISVARLRAFQEAGTTTLLASHDLGIVREFATRVIWLENGAIAAAGEVEEVTRAYQHAKFPTGEPAG